MGSSCVRDCVRSPTDYGPDDLQVPHSDDAASLGFGPPGTTNSCPSWPRQNQPSPRSSSVPPVPNWFQALQENRAKRKQLSPRNYEDGRLETPRFDEVLQNGALSARSVASESLNTPRGLAGGEFRTPRRSQSDSPCKSRGKNSAWEEGNGTIAEEEQEETYEGQYSGSKKHGTGRLRAGGALYEGDFFEDHKHGHGILIWDDGRKYRGEFKYGKFDGVAVMTWPDGRNYQGQYSEDRKHGEGTFSWHDGRRYCGQWVCGKRSGTGVYTNAKGFTRRGTWANDRPIQWDPVANGNSGSGQEVPQIFAQITVKAPEELQNGLGAGPDLAPALAAGSSPTGSFEAQSPCSSLSPSSPGPGVLLPPTLVGPPPTTAAAAPLAKRQPLARPDEPPLEEESCCCARK